MKPFVHSAFVHPFRHPSYHAQQLRAITFARVAQRRLLWVVVHDKLLQQDMSRRKDTEDLRKEQWLEFHDRFTVGLPSLLPLALGDNVSEGGNRALLLLVTTLGLLRLTILIESSERLAASSPMGFAQKYSDWRTHPSTNRQEKDTTAPQTTRNIGLWRLPRHT